MTNDKIPMPKLLPFEFMGTIAYKIRDSLYLNITNRCTDDCVFCVRRFKDGVKGYNLKLESEPSVEEIVQAVSITCPKPSDENRAYLRRGEARSEDAGADKRIPSEGFGTGYDPSKYREVVFCGYGEPTVRFEVVKDVARQLKGRGAKYIRLNTNGHGNLIKRGSIVDDMVSLVDEVCVSLNADTKQKYNRICMPEFGEDTYDKIKEFIIECKQKLPKVSLTFINHPEVDVDRCREIAKELGVDYRIRELGVVG